MALTFHGLARVARHVIGEFVVRAPKVERETLGYRKELPNIVPAQLSFTIWGTWSSGYDHKSARRYLGGFLTEDFTAILTSGPQATVTPTDIRALVEKAETLVPGLAKRDLLDRYIYVTKQTNFKEELFQPVYLEWERAVFESRLYFDILVPIIRLKFSSTRCL